MIPGNVKSLLAVAARLMRPGHRLLLLVTLSSLSSAGLRAAATAEGRAYDAARNMFYGGDYERAEKEFGEFIKIHPDSEKVPEAVVLQAQCSYQQQKLDEALALLRGRLVGAGKLADEYRYWIAESLFQKADYAGAATAFAQVLSDFPNSARRLAASLGISTSADTLLRRLPRPAPARWGRSARLGCRRWGVSQGPSLRHYSGGSGSRVSGGSAPAWRTGTCGRI